MNTIPVFVYGTLKREHGNHRALEGSKFLGEAQTVERYALQVQGLPMVDRKNPVPPIHGELYLVDRATLGDLDRLEGGWRASTSLATHLAGIRRKCSAASCGRWVVCFRAHQAGFTQNGYEPNFLGRCD